MPVRWNLPSDEIDQMVKDAEAHANEDKTRRERAEARNRADHVSYQTEKALADHGDKLSDDERSAVQSKLDDLKKVLGDESAEASALDSAAQAVLEASQVLGQKIYEEAQAAAPQAGTADDEGVVEAEIVDEGEES